jgi:hypothetical protein
LCVDLISEEGHSGVTAGHNQHNEGIIALRFIGVGEINNAFQSDVGI